MALSQKQGDQLRQLRLQLAAVRAAAARAKAEAAMTVTLRPLPPSKRFGAKRKARKEEVG